MRPTRWALGALACMVIATSSFAQTQEAVARTRFEKGRSLFLSGQYAPALVEFRAASDLYESPNTRLYIARCERALGHVASAFVELQRAASEAADRSAADPRYTSTRDVATQEAHALEGKIARVKVLAPAGLPDGASVTVNGADLGAAGVGVAAPIDPGAIEVVAKAPGYVTARRTASAAAGETVEVQIRLEKAPAQATTTTPTQETPTPTPTPTTTTPDVPPETLPHASHGLRNAGFVVGALGIAGMGVFATFAALAQTRFDQLKSDCAGGPCDATQSPRIDEGQTFQNVANVALAASGTLLLTGTIMIIAGVSTEHKTAVSIAPLPGGGFVAGFGRAF